MPGTLYLVATPIGNLQDMSFRAIETLKSVDIIACEDTRHTRKLLNAFDITLQKPAREQGRNIQVDPIALANARASALISYHEHNEAERAEELGELLKDGKSVALVSDAGTPGINDPGFRLLQKAHEIGAKVVPVPGPVAFVNAVIVSGIATDSIFFGGFLPSKSGDRRKRLAELKLLPATLVLYETPHRLVRSLTDCLDILGNRQAAVSRELTKLHEETVHGTLAELHSRFSLASPRGEFVLVIDRVQVQSPVEEKDDRSLAMLVAGFESEGLDRKTALKKAAKEFGLAKSEAYRILQSEKGR
ncbi:MAG: 16S rRNA (cytidine(1402)-2'-O)-methyltransferase [Blastocatellia bacterium]